MPSIENHPCFPVTIDRDQKIWRYMDFTKFMHLLTTKTIWFNRVDMFPDDPFEGTYPQINLQAIRGSGFAPLEIFNRFTRQRTYINCWYVSNHESAAMWKLYAQTNEAVAIQTTYEKLHMLMPENCYIGEVGYIDFQKDTIDHTNGYAPYMYKRSAFAHERELRALIQDILPMAVGHDGKNSCIDYSSINNKSGVGVSVDPLELIESICVAPMSSSWFKRMVLDICTDLGFVEGAIKTSSLEDTPY